jgi:hypothetical protein
MKCGAKASLDPLYLKNCQNLAKFNSGSKLAFGLHFIPLTPAVFIKSISKFFFLKEREKEREREREMFFPAPPSYLII